MKKEIIIRGEKYIISESTIKINASELPIDYLKEVEANYTIKEWREENKVVIHLEDMNPSITICEYGVVIKSGHLHLLIDLTHKLDEVKFDKYETKKYNKYFDIVVIGMRVYMIDREDVRFGCWHLNQLLETVPLKYGTKIEWDPDNKFEYTDKYPHLRGSHVGMGFETKDYTSFVNTVKQEVIFEIIRKV